MKKIIKRLYLMISVFIIMLCTAACGNGANIITDVTLEDDLSGTRVMEVSIAKSTLRDYFSGTVDDLKELIKDNCPEQLSYEISETESSFICVFKLGFDSIDTYRKKVAAILGEDREIEVFKGDTLLTQGILYEENFTSKELLGWFSRALIDNNFVSSSYENDIFESDNTTFIFSSNEYPSYERIYVSDIQYLPFGSIDILSKPYYDNTYDRTVVFHIPQYTMDRKGEEITAFLEEGVPSDAVTEWVTDGANNETLFKITMQRYNLDSLSSAMKSVFHSEAAAIENEIYKYDTNMLEHGQAIKETIDLSNFVSGDYAKANLRYFISSSSQPIVEENDSSGWSSLFYDSWNDDYADYICVYNRDITQTTLVVSTKAAYFPDAINVFTQVKGADKIKRDIELVYNDKIEENEALLLQDNINKAIEGLAEMEYAVRDNGCKIILKQSGTKEELNNGFQTIFNSPDSFVRYAKQRKMTAFSLTSVFEEDLRFNDFFGDNGYNIPINYEARLTGGEKINKASVDYNGDDGALSVLDNKISMKSENGRIYCSAVASKFNFYFLLYILLIILFIAAVAVTLYMGYLKYREKEAEENAEGKKTPGLIKDKVMHILGKKYCTVCNSYIDKKSKYCTKCGAKLE